MAKLIVTGAHEAIDLKALHGEDVAALDNVVDGLCQRNGGFAQLLINLRHGLFELLTINGETYQLRKERKRKLA